MAALDGWTVLPLLAALAAAGIIGSRARVVMFRAAVDGPRFARELKALVGAGRFDAAHLLAERLRPAWAAEIALRALPVRDDPNELRFMLEAARAEFALTAQHGFVAIRSLGRLALPLALAIAIVEIGRGFDPSPTLDRTLTAGHAIARGVFAVSTGMAVSIGCQLSYGVLARAAKQRLAEVQLATDVFAVRG